MNEEVSFATTEHWEGFMCPSRSLVQWKRRKSKGFFGGPWEFEEIKVTDSKVSGFLYYAEDESHSKVNGMSLKRDLILRNGKSEWNELISLSVAALRKMAIRRLSSTDEKLEMLEAVMVYQR